MIRIISESYVKYRYFDDKNINSSEDSSIQANRIIYLCRRISADQLPDRLWLSFLLSILTDITPFLDSLNKLDILRIQNTEQIEPIEIPKEMANNFFYHISVITGRSKSMIVRLDVSNRTITRRK